jgi:hypothetical protein
MAEFSAVFGSAFNEITILSPVAVGLETLTLPVAYSHLWWAA